MAPSGCTLEDHELVEQLERYRQLGRTALSIQQQDLQLVIEFNSDLDHDLLREAIAIEQQCCSYFALDYDPSRRRLVIAIDDPARADALRSLRSALSGTPPVTSRRSK